MTAHEYDPVVAEVMERDVDDRRYQQLIHEVHCGECKHCELPPRHMFRDHRVAYCREWADDFICSTDHPVEYDCEIFEWR